MTNHGRYGQMTMRRIAKLTLSTLVAMSWSIMSNLYFFELSFQNHGFHFEQKKILSLYVFNLEISTLPPKVNGRKWLEFYKSGKEMKYIARIIMERSTQAVEDDAK